MVLHSRASCLKGHIIPINNMKSFLVLAAAIASTSAFFVAKPKSPDVNFCVDGSQDWVSGIQLDVQPWPVVVVEGTTISLDGRFDLLKTVDEGTSLKLELTAKTPIGNLPIPCLEVEMDVVLYIDPMIRLFICQIGLPVPLGSCEYDAAELLTLLDGSGFCDQITPDGQACSLPLNPGAYADGTGTIEFTLGEISDLIKPFLHDIEAKVHIMDASGTENVCLDVTLEIEAGK